MKKISFTLIFILTCLLAATFSPQAQAQVLISKEEGTADESAMLEIRSTDGGVLIPRMTSGQRQAITAKEGLLVYDVTLKAFFIYGKDSKGNVTWYNISENAGLWSKNGDAVYLSDPDANVGIGTTNPNKKLVIQADSDTDTLMEIRDKNGNPLMIVTPQLTKFNFKENAGAAGTSGGFAVGRYALAKDGKATDTTLFVVTPDSTRVFTIGKENAGASGTSGGFAVGRYALAKDGKAKGNIAYNFFTDTKRTRVYTVGPETAGAAGTSGGFAVGRYALAKGDTAYNFFTDTERTRVFTVGQENAGAAGTSGGFAVGRYALAKGDTAYNFFTDTKHTRVYTVGPETAGAAGTSGGFAVGRYALAKGDTTYNFFTDQDSTKVVIPVSNERVGGFTVQGDVLGKGIKENKFDVSTGTTAEVINGQNRVLWYPQKNAFLAGRLYVPHADSVGENSLAIGYECQAKGNYSTAIGYSARADSISSFAFGDSAYAARPQSYAFGRGAKAIGLRSFAFGSGLPAGSSGDYSWDKAVAPQAVGDYSYAFGLGSVSEGYGSFTMGFKDTASGYFSMSMGQETKASGALSMATGYQSKAKGRFSTAMGLSSIAEEDGSTAIGYQTLSTGGGSTAIGAVTKATAEGSTAAGTGAEARGYASTAMGDRANAIGRSSIAFGELTTAEGKYSMATGHLTHAIGLGSTAMGEQTRAEGIYSIAIGYQALAKGDSSMAVGCETSAEGKYSMATGHLSHAIGLGSTAIGEQTRASGNYSTAMGSHTLASGRLSTAMGSGTEASGDVSTAMGCRIKVQGENSFGIGLNTFFIKPVITESNTMAIMGGRVGINTVAPEAPLDIETNTIGYAIHIEESYTGTKDWQIGVDSDGDLNFFDGSTNRISFRDGGNVGIGTISPTQKLHVVDNSTSNDAPAIYGEHDVTDNYGVGLRGKSRYRGVEGIAISASGTYPVIGVYGQADGGTSVTKYGVYGTASGGATAYAGYFSGNVNVTGTLSKGSGTFKIDHPLDPENKYLYHSFVESPDMMNIYNGNIVLDSKGEATVKLPDYFEALNMEFRYQLTPVGAPGPNLYIAQEISGNTFKIAGGSEGMKVSWQVTGIRHDPFAKKNRVKVEVEKDPQDKGKYLHPDVYNQAKEKGIDYQNTEEGRNKK